MSSRSVMWPQKLKRLSKPVLSDLELTEGDLFGISEEASGSLLLLGVLPISVVNKRLEKAGVYVRLERLGYGEFYLSLDTRDYLLQRIALYSAKPVADTLLAELIIKRRVEIPPQLETVLGAEDELLQIEWLMLQHPLGSFTKQRPQLPGQEAPGLGMGRSVLAFLMFLCRVSGAAGIINCPEYYHNAAIYARAASYIDPQFEARRQQLGATIGSRLGLAELSHAVEGGCVQENDTPFRWFNEPQLLPVAPTLRRFFRSRRYRSAVKEQQKKYRYKIDENCLKGLHL